jgi:hypothetical protein
VHRRHGFSPSWPGAGGSGVPLQPNNPTGAVATREQLGGFASSRARAAP